MVETVAEAILKEMNIRGSHSSAVGGGFENSFEIRRIGEEIALEKIKGIFDEFAYQGDLRRS